MVREATPADIPAMLDMGERFAVKAAMPFTFCRDSVAFTLHQLIDSPLGLVFVCEDGAAGGLCHPHPFNHEVLYGQELFWWSEGRNGGALLDALENGATDLGCEFWSMIALDTIHPEAMGRVYKRRGYMPLERSFVKEL